MADSRRPGHAASFRYRARDADGSVTTGTIEAPDRQRALQELAGRGLFPTKLEEVGGDRSASRESGGALRGPEPRAPAGTASPGAARSGRGPGGRIPRKAVTALTRELATLLTAAIPIPKALAGLAEQEESPAVRHVLLDLQAQVQSGRSLSQAMASYPRLFSKLYTSMIEVGEEAGALDRVLGDLADLLEREDEVRSEVSGAVAYPLFVLAMGAATTFVLLTFVLPRLISMLEDMVEALPLPTRVLLSVSAFFESYWHVSLGAAALGLLLVRSYARSPAGALEIDALKLKVPVVGRVVRAAVTGRFARTLGTLLHSGVSLLPALEIVRNTVGNRLVAEKIDRVAEETRGGDSLAAPLRRTGLFPPAMVQMVSVGEESGTLDTMLLKVAAMEERQVRSRSRTLISLLAPALILIVGAIVGFIVLALLLPIFRMSQTLR